MAPGMSSSVLVFSLALLHVPGPWYHHLGEPEPRISEDTDLVGASSCCPCQQELDELNASADVPHEVEVPAEVPPPSRRQGLVFAASTELFLAGMTVLGLGFWTRRRARPQVTSPAAQQRQFALWLQALGSVEQFREESLLELYVVWRGHQRHQAGRGRGSSSPSPLLGLRPDLLLQVSRFLLELNSSPAEEGLECLPEDFRQASTFQLERCVLGTPLGVEPLSLKLGNAREWKADWTTDKHLVVALPSGAWPWSRPSHAGVIALWFGHSGRYTPGLPAGPPVLKLPLASVTAMDCQNAQLRLEFTFDWPSVTQCKPARVVGSKGSLLVLTFPDAPAPNPGPGDGRPLRAQLTGLSSVSAFVQVLHAGILRAGGHPDVVPGLPNRGGLVPSRWYCRSSRQVAEILWAMLNVVLIVQPLWRLLRLGFWGLGLDGLLKLLVSRPQVAIQPIVGMVKRVLELRQTCRRRGDWRRLFTASLARR